ncbi:TadE family type IV pilus minor pilin [Nocardiopsis ansamitocini]|uniref:TadE-like protein n=1 Tax=Nocardiopsis ansamitocini TaxID=1670832 RepID=A0A9W6P4K1_9ACTN|nr:TadE family type IV pilus minor pilin [Nocardiopsis ansamitocini]GLU47215.1 hypothetical protein Nans01_15660 [Nocardiopsis ansamitocini]
MYRRPHGPAVSGHRPPGDRPGRERGTVTAEIAVSLPCLVFVLGVAIAAVHAAAVHLTCVDAARIGARALARGDAEPVIHTLVASLAPEHAQITLSRNGETVEVSVTAPVHIIPGLPAPASAVGTAVVPTEPGR